MKLPTPRAILPRLPVLAARPAAHAPFFIQKRALTRLLEHVLSDALAAGECDFLRGHWLRVSIQDIPLVWDFTLKPDRRIEVSRHQHCDVEIRGTLRSFLLLASRKEDPDTLFFQRDLVIEGDTELGLRTKNLLDTLELEALPPELVFLIRSGAEYVTVFQ
ncbi:SCP2 sterol-binding domain-containing protein [Hahella sp. SMD15-11]|uniref:Ubiquinone biosynthesis accessory factor UbiT n=1 Tax=Thermohahella caldifontis TaxID=3142973 RepID=A0AB39V0C3_9GAMM